MKFKIITRTVNTDNSVELVLFTPKEEVIVLGYILESFEGWFNYSTIDQRKQLFRVNIMKDFVSNADEILSFLKSWSPPKRNFY